MIVTKKSLATPDVSARHGCQPGAAAARCDGAGAVGDGPDGRQPGAPLRRRLCAERYGDGQLDADQRGPNFDISPILQPLSPFRDRHPRALGAGRAAKLAEPGVSCGRLDEVPDRRAGKPDRRRHGGRPLDRPAGRPDARRADAAGVARARARRPRHQRLMRRRELRVPQHNVVEQRHDAAADRARPAGRIRADVRRDREHRRRRTARRICARHRSILDSVKEAVADLGRGLGPERSAEDRRVPGRRSRHRAADRQRPRSAAPRRCRWWRSPPASRRTSKRTCS